MKSHKMKKIIFSGLLIIILLCYGFCVNRIQEIRKKLPAEDLRAEALMVNPNLLRIVSGEFKGIMADYLLLKASIFLGGTWQMAKEDWEALAVLFEQSLVLDPYFMQTGYYIQGILVWHPGMEAKAIELLELHSKNRYWDWEPKFYLGFDCFYFLKNNDKAAQYLSESAKLPGAPPIVSTLGARLAQRSGQTLTAIAMLKTLYERNTDEMTKNLLMRRIQAYLGIYQIEQAVFEYVKRYGQRPAALDDLVKMNVLKQLPINPLDHTFYYDPESGNISFDKFR